DRLAEHLLEHRARHLAAPEATELNTATQIPIRLVEPARHHLPRDLDLEPLLDRGDVFDSDLHRFTHIPSSAGLSSDARPAPRRRGPGRRSGSHRAPDLPDLVEVLDDVARVGDLARTRAARRTVDHDRADGVAGGTRLGGDLESDRAGRPLRHQLDAVEQRT